MEELKALKKIVDEVKKERNLNQKELALEMGISPSVLSETLNGKRGRRPKKILSLLHDKLGVEIPNEEKEISDVHPVDDFKEQEAIPYTENSNGIKFYEREDGQILLEAPLVPFNALGSPDDEFAPMTKDEDKSDVELFEVDSIHHGDYVSFEVDGDSMDDGTYDGFRRGDKVLVRKLSRDLWLPRLHFNKWPFWVVVFGNCVRLKQIVAQDEKTGTITLHSLNPSPEYTDFTLNLDDIHLLYNVVLKKPKQIRYGNF